MPQNSRCVDPSCLIAISKEPPVAPILWRPCSLPVDHLVHQRPCRRRSRRSTTSHGSCHTHAQIQSLLAPIPVQQDGCLSGRNSSALGGVGDRDRKHFVCDGAADLDDSFARLPADSCATLAGRKRIHPHHRHLSLLKCPLNTSSQSGTLQTKYFFR